MVRLVRADAHHLAARHVTDPCGPPAGDPTLSALFARALADPAWWLVVDAYQVGKAMFPDPFQARGPL